MASEALLEDVVGDQLTDSTVPGDQSDAESSVGDFGPERGLDAATCFCLSLLSILSYGRLFLSASSFNFLSKHLLCHCESIVIFCGFEWGDLSPSSLLNCFVGETRRIRLHCASEKQKNSPFLSFVVRCWLCFLCCREPPACSH